MGAAETQRLRRRIDASQAEQVTEKAKAAGVVLEADLMARIDEVLQLSIPSKRGGLPYAARSF
jgi:hypothetical protein